MKKTIKNFIDVIFYSIAGFVGNVLIIVLYLLASIAMLYALVLLVMLALTL